MTARFPGKCIIAAVAIHSLLLATGLLLRPVWTLALFGWHYDGPLFFPAQSGVFLLLLGCAYLAGVWYRPFAWLLVASKAAAVVFLLTQYSLGAGPRVVVVAAVLDGLMGLIVAAVLLHNTPLHPPPAK